MTSTSTEMPSRKKNQQGFRASVSPNALRFKCPFCAHSCPMNLHFDDVDVDFFYLCEDENHRVDGYYPSHLKGWDMLDEDDRTLYLRRLRKNDDFSEWFITFTRKDTTPRTKIVKNVMNMINRKALKIVDWGVVPEHADSNFHIHCYVKTEMKKINKGRWLNRLDNYLKYGLIDVRPAKDKAGCEYYMSKENEIISSSEGLQILFDQLYLKENE